LGAFAVQAGFTLLPERGFVEGVTVIVEGTTITRVVMHGGSVAEGLGSHIVSAPSSTLLPGLIDSHVHLSFSGGPDPLGDVVAASDVELGVRVGRDLSEEPARASRFPPRRRGLSAPDRIRSARRIGRRALQRRTPPGPRSD
jgi:cytosine/adenosine deaminase-related metal-dependent hydrolase